MKVGFSKKDFTLHFIEREYRKNFWEKRKENKDLSDAETFLLRVVGDALRGPKSQHFWCDGEYRWYTDETQSHEQSVWLTDNGILMFSDLGKMKVYNGRLDCEMYRVHPEY